MRYYCIPNVFKVHASDVAGGCRHFGSLANLNIRRYRIGLTLRNPEYVDIVIAEYDGERNSQFHVSLSRFFSLPYATVCFLFRTRCHDIRRAATSGLDRLALADHQLSIRAGHFRILEDSNISTQPWGYNILVQYRIRIGLD